MTKASELAHLAAIILAPNLMSFLESKCASERQGREVRDEAVKMAVRTAAAVLAASEDFEHEQRQVRSLDRVPAGMMWPEKIRPGDEVTLYFGERADARPSDDTGTSVY